MTEREFRNEVLGEWVAPEEPPPPPPPRRKPRHNYGYIIRRQINMEKRGVVLDDEKTKTADVTKKCPKCGAELRDPDCCGTCGTEPFEKRK